MPQIDPIPVGVALNSSGAISSGALCYVYTAGTTVPVTTYSDAALSVAHAYPVVASAAGTFAPIYLPAGNYKVDLRNAEGASLSGYPRDEIVVTASGTTTGATYGRAIQLSDDYSNSDDWTIEAAVGISARAREYDATTALFDGPYVLEFAGDATDTPNKVQSASSVAVVTPGQAYRVTAPVYATGSPTSTFEIGFEWYNAAGSALSTDVVSTNNAAISSGQVKHATATAVAPASAASMRIILQRVTASVTGNWYAGAARLEIGLPKSGLDADLVTGTAGAAGDLAAWNGDGDLVAATAASQVEMEAGTEAALRAMSPLRVGQAITALAGWTYLSPQASTSGTAVDFTIPSGAREISVGLSGVSVTGTDGLLVQLGDAGGIEATGYEGAAFNSSADYITTTGFFMHVGGASRSFSGDFRLAALTDDGFTWSAQYAGLIVTAATGLAGGGVKTLSAALTTVRVAPSGSDSFDAGTIYCAWRT